MTPTNKLRFVEREVPMSQFYIATDGFGNTMPAKQTLKILQQWWEGIMFDFITGNQVGEWRDVPVEKEET